ncbi:spermine/spermidine N-acetyltransferase [Propionispira arboris]|uniref:Spermine/spermidine N-acetyltransferase n=1 Tax=Propionispira arboris TaxID=84035 RepID=A0A1H6Y6G0_9FIRM|nr:N-acetyltransferase [Propionispira arboris]SEJ34627.1 spermine/spermidine N-acetyltransferase [Propionispira arboris]
MDFIIRQCTKDDAVVLQEISRQTYRDTFSTASTVADMEDYLQKAYDLVKLKKEILNKNTFFYFIITGRTVVGYLKLNIGAAQTDIKDDFSLEIERIYVRKEAHGQKFGAVLMNKAIEMAKVYQKQYIWLGVWENNQRAFNFYQKNRFYKIGEHEFVMGKASQVDWLLRKDLC